jgi:AbrB family looped-hinge helix DNA binding protein
MSMKTTLDREGKVAIPPEIQDKAGLKPGEEVEVTLDEGGIRLCPRVPGPKLVRVGQRWVARPRVPAEDRPKVDVAELIRKERDRWPL